MGRPHRINGKSGGETGISALSTIGIIFLYAAEAPTTHSAFEKGHECSGLNKSKILHALLTLGCLSAESSGAQSRHCALWMGIGSCNVRLQRKWVSATSG